MFVPALLTAPVGHGAAGLLPPGEVAVVTGQQPAVGGGPLYSLIKAAAAVALAGAVDQVGRPCRPIYWCAGEDHDLGEADHADLIRRDGTIVRVRADLGPGRASLRFRSARSGWDDLLSALERELGSGLGRAFVHDLAPTADEDLAHWCGRLFSALFPGLLVVQPQDLRSSWTEAMERALVEWPGPALREVRRRELAVGHADAFGELDAPPLFRDAASGRTPLTVDQARAVLATEPDLLSPGAALRPVLQQIALPAIAYVAGPGELAYHRFIAPVYEALQAPAPILVPRPSLTLVPGWCRRALEDHGLTPETVGESRSSLAPMTTGALAQVAQAVAALGRDRPDLSGSVRRLEQELKRAEVSDRRLRDRAAGRPPVGQLQAFLAPRNGRQERTMSLIQALWLHGPGLAQVLVRTFADAVHGEHQFLDV